MNRSAWAAGAATVLVIVVAVLGFHALGGPRTQRLIQLDNRTLQRVSTLAQQINWRWSATNKILPADLEGFPKALTEDPVTHKRISYRPKSDSGYELCATFAAESPNNQASNPNDPTNFWFHPKGDYCFQFDAPQQPPFFYNY